MRKDSSSALLPNGLSDLLPPNAEQEAHIVSGLMQCFAQFGYQRVKPSLVEFEETLLADGPGKALARNTFRLMDPISQHMMGVRADTTAQIARIANSRLKEETRPLRLSYAADVLRVNGSQLRPERQFCQVGCELVGANNVHDDAEVALFAVKSLHDAGVKDLSIDLTIPSLIDVIFDAFKVEAIERNNLEAALKKRDRDALTESKNKAASAFVDLLDASGLAQTAIEALKKIELPKTASEYIKNVVQIYDGLTAAFGVYNLSDVSVTIDLIERRGFEYQNGVSYTLFSKQVRGELGRGGRYILAEVSQENASGFTLYMDSVKQAIAPIEAQKSQTVKSNTDWDEIKKLQDQGIAVSRG